MTLLLALETCTRVSSVALARLETDDAGRVRADAASPARAEAAGAEMRILAEFTTDGRRVHSQRLLPMIDRVLAEAGIRPSDLGAVACSVGPGSFTGLRIGLATAKGLAFALGTAVVGVPTLDALAQNLGIFDPGRYPLPPGVVVCPILDACKGQVYAATYGSRGPDHPGSGRLDGPWVLSPAELEDRLAACLAACPAGEGLIFLGDGADLLWPRLLERFGARAAMAPAHRRYPRATGVAVLAAGALAGAGGRPDAAQSLASLTPLYLRPPEAELKAAASRERGNAPWPNSSSWI